MKSGLHPPKEGEEPADSLALSANLIPLIILRAKLSSSSVSVPSNLADVLLPCVLVFVCGGVEFKIASFPVVVVEEVSGLLANICAAATAPSTASAQELIMI